MTIRNRVVKVMLIIVCAPMLVTSGCSRRGDELREAVRAGDHQALRSLLAAGASPDHRDHLGATPLHWAVTHGDTNSVKLLLKAGASVSATANDGRTPILQAAVCGELACGQILLDAGASIDAVDEMGQGFVHGASSSAGDRDLAEIESCLRFALDNGLNLNQTDIQGFTALDWADIHGYKDIHSLLKRMGGISGEAVRARDSSMEGRKPRRPSSDDPMMTPTLSVKSHVSVDIEAARSVQDIVDQIDQATSEGRECIYDVRTNMVIALRTAYFDRSQELAASFPPYIKPVTVVSTEPCKWLGATPAKHLVMYKGRTYLGWAGANTNVLHRFVRWLQEGRPTDALPHPVVVILGTDAAPTKLVRVARIMAEEIGDGASMILVGSNESVTEPKKD